MNKRFSWFAIILVAALCGYTGASLHRGTVAGATETGFDRVMRTNTLRCGYYVFPPALSIDAKTGEKTGFAVDMTNDLAKRLNLNVEWTEEVTFGTMMEALKTKRFDAICTPVWLNAAQGRAAEYTRDLFYAALIGVVRNDDNRFDNDYTAANNENVVFATIDGEISAAVAASDFPQAKTLSIPNNSSLAQLFMNVADKKADIVFRDLNVFNQYQKENPGRLKIAANGKPVRIYPFVYAVGKGEFALLGLLNTALTEMLYDGSIEKAVKKNELFPNSYLFVTTPYRSN